ncbi:PCI domain containing 2, isoform CRA_b, partial [Mus musculus]
QHPRPPLWRTSPLTSTYSRYMKPSTPEMEHPVQSCSNLKDDYSTAQRITYKYYVGRKAMFDSDFKQAEEYLSFAFEHCHRSSQKNKRMILIYLLPVKMLLGHMPTIELLRKYHLMQFSEVTKAV